MGEIDGKIKIKEEIIKYEFCCSVCRENFEYEIDLKIHLAEHDLKRYRIENIGKFLTKPTFNVKF